MSDFRLRHLDVDDKVCEQVDLSLVEEIYPKEAILRCVEQNGSWSKKNRRIRQTTVLSLVFLLLWMGLWSRLNQPLVWQKLVGKLSDLHPGEKNKGNSVLLESADGAANWDMTDCKP